MPDPELVEYCRQNLAEHPLEEIRASLLSEGIEASEVDAALVLAVEAPPARRPRPATPARPSLLAGLGWLVFFCAVIGLLMAVIWHFSALEGKPAKALGEIGEGNPEKTPAQAPASGKFYSGHFGYALKLPTGFAATEGLCDLKTRVETLLVHPVGSVPAPVGDTQAFLRSGGVLLQAYPRKDPQKGLLDLATLSSWYSQQARGARGRFAVEEAPGLPLPAFRLRYSGGRRDVFLQGKHAFYHLSSFEDGKPGVDSLAAGLTEPDPKDGMQGFLLVKEDPKLGKVYWHEEARATVTLPPGFERVETFSGRGMRYDFAFKHRTEPFEVRVRFDSTAEATREYLAKKQQPCWKQGTCLAQDPDDPTDSWSSAVAMNMTETPFSFDMIPERLTQEDFGADWGTLSPSFALSPTKPFNHPYKAGVILQLHKSGVGHYYVMFLAETSEVLNRLTNIPEVTYCVKFPATAP